MNAQVGVNNPNPNQALDVAGKIKITDDATTPTKGTMRYNDTNSSFEGHNGTQWSSFTSKATAALPTNPVPVYGYSPGVAKGTRECVYFKTWESSGTYSTPPNGKFLVVTGIYPRPNSLSTDTAFQFTIGVSQSLAGSVGTQNYLAFMVETKVTAPIVADGAPLFVVKSGEYLTVINESTSSINYINIHIRGFLVDDLNY